MPTLSEIAVHDQRTQRSAYQYQFTPKHHGAVAGTAQWLPELTLAEEFAVFDTADLHELSDDDGNLYGLARTEDGGLRYLGTWNQQLAEFPVAREGEPWHGYPLYPVNDDAPENRRGQKHRPAKEVFAKMRNAGLITRSQRKRLMKGKHASAPD